MFLDEIGDLPLELQPPLLRAVQEREFERLGGSQTIRVNVRVVAAPNQDLEEMVERKQFRADLYLPAERDSDSDAAAPRARRRHSPDWCSIYVRRFSARIGRSIDVIPLEVMEALKAHDWPGNIQGITELYRTRGGSFLQAPVLRPTLTDFHSMTRQQSATGAQTLADASREHILEVLEQTGWVIGGRGGAAERLGLPRTTLIYKMRKLGIEVRRAPRGRLLTEAGSEPG